MKKILTILGCCAVAALVLFTASEGSTAESISDQASKESSSLLDDAGNTTVSIMRELAGMDNVSDSELQKRFEKALNPYKNVKVSAKDGVVTLTGSVNSQEQKNRILNAARESGYTVNDKMTVTTAAATEDKSETVSEYVGDAATTAVVKAKFLAQKGLDSLDIHVETTDGVVTLNGEVDNSAQVSLAENVAKEADGVTKVINNLVVKP